MNPLWQTTHVRTPTQKNPGRNQTTIISIHHRRDFHNKIIRHCLLINSVTFLLVLCLFFPSFVWFCTLIKSVCQTLMHDRIFLILCVLCERWHYITGRFVYVHCTQSYSNWSQTPLKVCSFRLLLLPFMAICGQIATYSNSRSRSETPALY